MTEPQPTDEVSPHTSGPSRRTVLTGAAGLLAGLGLGAAGAQALQASPTVSAPVATPDTAAATVVVASGRTQAGIDRPETPQRAGLVVVLDLDRTAGEPQALPGWLAPLGARILDLTGAQAPAEVLPDGAGDLTVTVGLGPDVIGRISPDLPGAQDLPNFVGDDAIAEHNRGGDVMLAIHATDAGILHVVARDLAALVPGKLRWQQRVFRGPGEGTVVRNPAGFHDGVIVPRGEEELAENVWLNSTDGPVGTDLAGATVCVLRRLRIDLDRLAALPMTEQERVFGRRHFDGAPLSGGGPLDEVDLHAKHPDGELVLPARSHARAAHPSFTGSELMLRRSYAYDDGLADEIAQTGLLFVCFQRSLRTFTATQHRLDETDDLMGFLTPTASATFLILPGHSIDRPLGAGLAKT